MCSECSWTVLDTRGFLLLGSTSPDLIRNVSETLAGRIELVELAGFDLRETGTNPSTVSGCVVASHAHSSRPRTTTAPPGAKDSFGPSWSGTFHNWDHDSRSGDATLLDDARPLSRANLERVRVGPRHEPIGQNRACLPRYPYRDSWSASSSRGLTTSANGRSNLPKSTYAPGCSTPAQSFRSARPPRSSTRRGVREGFALEQVLQTLKLSEAFFWATHSGAEIDLFFLAQGRHFGVEVTLFNEAPHVTRSMHIALGDLDLDHLWIIYPGQHAYPVHEHITVWPLREVAALPNRVT